MANFATNVDPFVLATTRRGLPILHFEDENDENINLVEGCQSFEASDYFDGFCVYQHLAKLIKTGESAIDLPTGPISTDRCGRLSIKYLCQSMQFSPLHETKRLARCRDVRDVRCLGAQLLQKAP